MATSGVFRNNPIVARLLRPDALTDRKGGPGVHMGDVVFVHEIVRSWIELFSDVICGIP